MRLASLNDAGKRQNNKYDRLDTRTKYSEVGNYSNNRPLLQNFCYVNKSVSSTWMKLYGRFTV